MDPSFSYCSFDEYKNNTLTKEYCSLKAEIKKLETTDVNFDKKFNSSEYIPYFMFGGFVIIATLMISGSIYMITKRREIMAFSTQQVMPIAQEGIEKMTPTMSKVVEDMSPTMKKVAKDMAPIYGDIAKEITKGIKEGKEDNFVVGMEESYGYLRGIHARDKDAVVASLMICEMAAVYKLRGISLKEFIDSSKEFLLTALRILIYSFK